jgi:seryl-tRNA synthetase
MIDIKLLRENPEAYKTAAEHKGIQVDIDQLLELDHRVRRAKQKLQEVRTTQNSVGKKIAQCDSEPERHALIQEMSELKTQAQNHADHLRDVEYNRNGKLRLVPQPADEGVPVGKDESENVEVRRVGEIRRFDFPMKDHVELGTALGILDVERGVRLAGSRNYVLKAAGAMLHHAVLQLAVDQMVARGYELLNVPMLVRDEVMYGTGYFPVGRDQAYLVERDGLSLAGTAEVPVTALHSEEILDGDELPRKYVALSTCYRREAGAAGKDTHGLYRIHYFDKVEQVIIAPNDRGGSVALHEEILANAEDLLKALELPYRVVNVCTGDLGQGQVQKFDIETWMPSRESYGETHSASRFYEFQARRLNMRYRDGEGNTKYCHTLNNTVIASPRVLIPILELNQNADGSVTVPPALRPYMHGMEKIEAGGT